jgi:hypothetical protein
MLSVRDFKASARRAGSVMSRLVGCNIDPPVFESGGSTVMLFDCVDMSRSKEVWAFAIISENVSGVSELERLARSSSITGGKVVGEVARILWKDRTADAYICGVRSEFACRQS